MKLGEKRVKPQNASNSGRRRPRRPEEQFNPGLRSRRRAGLFDMLQRWAAERALHRTQRGESSGISRAFLKKVALVCLLGLVVAVGISAGITAYIRSKQVSIRIDNGSKVTEVTTSARTVRELIDNNVISLGPYDSITPSENTRLTANMVVTIDRAMVLFVTTGGEMRQVYMTTGTVADALKKANITYDSDDIVTPALDTALLPGMRIKHVAVEYKIVSEYSRVPYEVEYRSAGTVELGTTLLGQKGQEGTKTREIKVTMHDGEEVERTQLSEVMTKEPVNKVILNGTKPTPTPTPKPTPTKKPGTTTTKKPTATTTQKPTTATKQPTTDGKYSHVTAADLKIPAAPGSFESSLVMEVTAYTHTGGQVAIGGWPQYTRTREKPGTLAVDPDTIPYRTLVYVTGYGYARTEDTGSFKGTRPMQSDVFMNTTSECIKWGRRRGVVVYIVQYNYNR
ncbi:MAG: ubiquitin-like domain-containing protein [Eubacteriales bacterium]|nr:ubiquitin-like domain-containing protein [Eubacteriales bacterium]